MESGFRRLWHRTRNKNRQAQLDSVSVSQTATNVNKPSRNAPNGQPVLPQSGRPAVLEYPRPSTDKRDRGAIPTANGHAGATGRNKIQPTLVGISRPIESVSRPGTAGSFQNAVDRAADTVAQPSFDHQRNRTRSKVPRYVDIFSISSAKPSTSYNEDIAERNLDMVRVATESGAHYRHVQGSTYQEEVATRNAYPAALVRPSTDTTRTNREQPRPRNPTPQGQPLVAAAVGHSKTSSADTTIEKAVLEDPVAYHWRQQRLRALDYAKQLPPLPQAHDSGSYSGVGSDEDPLQHENAVMTVNRPSTETGVRSHGLNSDRSQEVVTPQESGIQPMEAISSALPSYQLSPSELSPPREVVGHSRATTAKPPPAPFQQSENFSRSPLTPTSASVKRAINLANRTIMDLTGNDSEVFADSNPGFNSRAPVMDGVSSDSSHRLQPSAIMTTRATRTTDSEPAPSVSEDTRPSTVRFASPDEASQQSEKTFHTPPRPVPQTTSNLSPSSFSPISTLVSVSPKIRPANELQPPIPADLPRPQQQSRMVKVNKLDSVAEIERESEEQNVFDDVSTRPQPIPAAQELVGVRDFAPVTAASVPLASSVVSSTRASSETRPHGELVTSSLPPESATTEVTPKAIQTSPESLNSADFVHPSGTFGVLTRDFADSPTRPAPARSTASEAREPNVGAKVKPLAKPSNVGHISSQSVSTPVSRTRQAAVNRTPVHNSTFNEEEFALKRAQARAALIKLQQSLDEDFHVDQPPPRRSSKANGVRRAASPGDDRPVAPSSIFLHNRDNSVDVEDRKAPLPERGHQATQAHLSIHELVTQPTSRSSSIKPMPRSYPQPRSRSQSKGKQREVGFENENTSYIDRMNDLVMQAASLNLLPPHPSYRQVKPNGLPFPPSPGEVSLSSFPIPISEAAPSVKSMHSHGPSISTPRGKLSSEIHRPLQRRGSTRSQASSNSAFSIPYHMIPDRSSSMRDQLVREEGEEDEA